MPLWSGSPLSSWPQQHVRSRTPHAQRCRASATPPDPSDLRVRAAFASAPSAPALAARRRKQNPSLLGDVPQGCTESETRAPVAASVAAHGARAPRAPRRPTLTGRRTAPRLPCRPAPRYAQLKDLSEGVEEGTVWDGGGHRYQLEHVVGNGAFGIVWRARSEDGEVVAIKKVMLDRRYHNRELQMMKVMEHENVVRLRHHFEKAGKRKDETFLHLVMDYLPETIRSVALKHHKRAKRFHIDHIRAYLWQTFRALEYIHGRRICHRDIKPDNLLCDPSTLKCRLCDFGCSKVLVKGQPNVSYICSRYYRAPELMFGATEYAVSVDVWSVGTIMVELLLGHLPFQGQDSTQQHLVEIMKLLGTPTDRDLHAMRATCSADDLPKLKPYPWERIFPSSTPQEAIDLAQRLLRYDPDERLTATQALAHPFFDGIEQLLNGTGASTGSSSSLAPLPSPSPAAQRPPMKEADWERRVAGLFDELRASWPMGSGVSEQLMRQIESVVSAGASAQDAEAAVQQLSGLVRQSLSLSQRQLANAIQQRLVDVSTRHMLPCEMRGRLDVGRRRRRRAPPPPPPPMAAAPPPSEGDAAEAERVKGQLEQLKRSQRALTEALAEKNDLAARVKSARLALEGGGGAGGGGANGDGNGGGASADGERSGGVPGFGRRAHRT